MFHFNKGLRRRRRKVWFCQGFTFHPLLIHTLMYIITSIVMVHADN
jgi:hypothetical protein